MIARTFHLHRRQLAFSLIELLVVMAILAVLIALLLPAVQKVREAAQRTSCLNNLRQLVLALNHYENQSGGFPPGTRTTPAMSWMPPVLPFIEQQNVAYDLSRNWDDPANLSSIQVPLKVLICPATPSSGRIDPGATQAAAGDYVAIHGVNEMFYTFNGFAPTSPINNNGVLVPNGSTRMAEITDGTTMTILIVEAAGRPELWRVGRRVTGSSANPAWADPANEIGLDGSAADGSGGGPNIGTSGACVINCTNDNEIYSFHNGGAHVAFVDGSIHFLSANISPQVVAALVTKAGGEVIPESEY